jgi:PAS domain S-box-containing protein
MRRRINRDRNPAKKRSAKARTSKRHNASNSRRHRSEASAGDAADEALSSSEHELRLLVDTIPTLVWTARPEGDIEYVNKRVLEYFGAPLSEIIGWGWVEKVHPDDVAFKTRTWLTHLDSRTAHDAVCRFRGADGQYRWFAVSGAPLKAGDGRVLRWYGVMIDIDDRKAAAEAIRESEYKLRQIIDTVPGLIWSTAPNGEPTHVSQRLLDYSGTRFEDFKLRGWEAFVHPADFPETANAYNHAIQTGTSYKGVLRLRRSDGEFRWHHARCEPLRDRQGHIMQWYGLSVDIDERKKAVDRLRRGEAHLAEAQRLSQTGASTYNATTILYWSEETYRIFGFDPRDGLPSREAVWQRIHADDRNRVRAQVEDAQSGKGGFSSEFRIVLPDGTVKYVESIRQPVFSTNGELIEVVATQIDVTERKRAEQALRESEGKFRDYAETASDWFWEIGPDYKFTLLTENAFGSGSQNRIGTACWDSALDLETEPEKWRLILAALDSRQPFRDFVYRVLSGSGSPMYVKASGKPVSTPLENSAVIAAPAAM